MCDHHAKCGGDRLKEKEREGQADRGTGRTVTWAVAVLMENKSRRMFRTWKQADWRDKKAGKLSMKGVGFLLGGRLGEGEEWSRLGIEKLTFGQTELPVNAKLEYRFWIISDSGKITAKNVMNYKVKREGKRRRGV